MTSSYEFEKIKDKENEVNSWILNQLNDSLIVDDLNGSVSISGDDGYELYLNGTLIGADNNSWQTSEYWDLNFEEGINNIAIKGINDANGTHPGAVIADFNIGSHSLVTDSSWLISTDIQNGWNTNLVSEQNGYSSAYEYGDVNSTTWFKSPSWPSDTLENSKFPANSSAKWIWSGGLQTDSNVYIRKDIYIDDATDPVISSFSPADDATRVAIDSNIILNFTEAVDVETGNIVIYKASDDSVVETIDVNSSKVTGTGSSQITINPSNDFKKQTEYYVQIDATAFDDYASNSYGGISDKTTLSFTTTIDLLTANFNFDYETNFSDLGIDIDASFSTGSSSSTYIYGGNTARSGFTDLSDFSISSEALTNIFSDKSKLLEENEIAIIKNKNDTYSIIKIIDSKRRWGDGDDIDGVTLYYGYLEKDLTTNVYTYSNTIKQTPSSSYFSISDLTIIEGESDNITISRTGETTKNQNVKLVSSDGTATAGSDYLAINETISFAVGETTKTIEISSIEDTLHESNETFSLTLTESNLDDIPAQITDGNATITINDDDDARGVIRGNSFYKIIDAPSWTEAEANAKNLGGNLVTINNKEEYSWGAQNIWSKENFVANGYNEDTLSYVGFNDKDNEGNYQWSSGENTDWNNLTDLITAQNWFAQQGSFGSWDYGIIFPDSDWEEVGTDERYTPYENRGTIVLMDDNASFYRRRGSSIAGIAEVPLSYFEITDLKITEGDSGIVTISRTGGTKSTQNLTLISSSGTANVGIDYTDINETVSFAAGETSKTITIFSIDDTISDENETFYLTLTASSEDKVPAQITDGNSTITIIDNDEKHGLIRGNSFYKVVDGPSWTQAEANAVALGGHLVAINDLEENQWLLDIYDIDGLYPVNHKERDEPSAGEEAYWIGLTDQDSEGNWQWSNNENTIYRNWLDDTATGGSGTPNGLSSENYAYIGGYVDGTWDDQPNNSLVPTLNKGIAEIPLSYFSISDLTITEGDRGNITITRTGGKETTQNLLLNSSDGTATGGSDYQVINEIVSFLAGETSKKILFTSLEDSNEEFNETLFLTLTASSEDEVPSQITDGTAYVIISDDDQENIDPIKGTTPSYSISTQINIPREGYICSTTISTKNVEEGTTLYWSVGGENIDISDFAQGLMNGSGSIGADGNFSFEHFIANDGMIEGYEVFNFKLFSDEERTNQIAATRPLTIQDSAITEQIADIITDLQGISKVVTNLVQGNNYTLKHIRDFDGNSHANSSTEGVDSAYKYQNTIDINGDGIEEAIYTNLKSGRWVTASIDPSTGKIDYSDYGEGGTTRVVGIYDDPLIAEGNKYGGYLSDGKTPAPAQFGATGSDRYIDLNGDGDFDDENEDRLALNSQVRFQRDLEQDNLITKVSNDYDGDGVFEVYWKTSDNTAYLRALMHDDGNIRYANYQSAAQMNEYLTAQGHESLIAEII